MNGPFTSAADATLQPFFDKPEQQEPESDLIPRQDTLNRIIEVGANAQAAPAQQAQGFGGRFADIPFGGQVATEVDPMLAQQAEQAAGRGIYEAKLRTPARADFGRPLKEYQQSIEQAEAMQRPESLAAAEKAVQENKDKFDAAQYELMGYNPSPAAIKGFGSKFFAAMSIALGEMARGLRGGKGQNIGLDMINKIVDDEARRQQQEYARLKDRVNLADNAYARAVSILGDERQAFRFAKDAMYNQALNKANLLGDEVKATQGYNQLLADISNSREMNKQEISQAQYEGGIKLAQEMIKQDAKLKGDLSKAGQLDVKEASKYDAIAGSLAQVSSDVGTALESLEGYMKRVPKEKQGEIGAIFREAISASRSEDPGAMNTFINTLSRRSLGDPDLNRFYNIIGKVAFGLASKDQAASSISNRDVQNFQQFLADPAQFKDQIKDYLNKFKILTLADARFNEAIAKNNTYEQAVAYRDKYLREQGMRLVGGVYQNDATIKADAALKKYIGTKQQNVSSPGATAVSPMSDVFSY